MDQGLVLVFLKRRLNWARLSSDR